MPLLQLETLDDLVAERERDRAGFRGGVEREQLHDYSLRRPPSTACSVWVNASRSIRCTSPACLSADQIDAGKWTSSSKRGTTCQCRCVIRFPVEARFIL